MIFGCTLNVKIEIAGDKLDDNTVEAVKTAIDDYVGFRCTGLITALRTAGVKLEASPEIVDKQVFEC